MIFGAVTARGEARLPARAPYGKVAKTCRAVTAAAAPAANVPPAASRGAGQPSKWNAIR
jgi:hypothetical protein